MQPAEARLAQPFPEPPWVFALAQFGRIATTISFFAIQEQAMIDPEQVYFLTHRGKSELAAAGTSLSPAELALLVLIDGKATVRQVQASAADLAPSEVIEGMQRLLRSEHIALMEIDLGNFFAASSARETQGEMPDESVIERGVSSLRQNGYIVRIARRPPSASEPTSDRNPTVIAVEDDPDLAANMRIALTHAGFAVRLASNREQVVAALRQSPLPDLVLLDVTLPDVDGFTILAKMRQHPMLAKVPVIMVTGAATREAVLKGLAGGANGYITKPFEIGVMLKAVWTVLGIGPRDEDAESNFLWEDAR